MTGKQQGLTLIELMVTLAVAIVLITVGMPLFTGMVANNRATTQANSLLAAFKLARSEAVRRSSEVSICAVADPSATPATCGTNTDWANGVVVFSDAGTAGAVDGGDERLKVLPNEIASLTAAASAAFIRFRPQGEVDTASLVGNAVCPGSGSCLELGDTGSTGSQTHCVHVMRSGQVRLERAPCS